MRIHFFLSLLLTFLSAAANAEYISSVSLDQAGQTSLNVSWSGNGEYYSMGISEGYYPGLNCVGYSSTYSPFQFTGLNPHTEYTVSVCAIVKRETYDWVYNSTLGQFERHYYYVEDYSYPYTVTFKTLEEITPVNPTIPFTDTFARRNATFVVGPSWNIPYGYFQIYGNQLQTNSANGGLALLNNISTMDAALTTNYDVSSNNSTVGLVSRYRVESNGQPFYYVAQVTNTNGYVAAVIYKFSQGSFKFLGATGSLNGKVRGKMTFDYAGANFKIFLENNAKESLYVQDHEYIGPGAAGIRGWAQGGSIAQWNDFAIKTTTSNSVFASDNMDDLSIRNSTNINASWTEFGDMGTYTNPEGGGFMTFYNFGVAAFKIGKGTVTDTDLKADYDIYGGFASTSFASVGLMARHKNRTGEDDSYLFHIGKYPSGYYAEIIRILNGQYTTLSSKSLGTDAAFGALRFKVVGTTLEGYVKVKGSSKDAKSWTLTNSVTDSAIPTGGTIALRGFNNVALDNAEAQALR